jgi:hypothetical protein
MKEEELREFGDKIAMLFFIKEEGLVYLMSGKT